MYKVLIIEDEPILCQFYTMVLESMYSKKETFTITVANSYDAAYLELESVSQKVFFDLVILDIRLRDAIKKQTFDGENLGLRIRESMPNTKILVITSYDNNYRYHTIFQTVKPDGFLVKYDLNDEDFISAVKSLLANKNYYSHSVTKYLNRRVSNKTKIDDLDIKLLYLLSLCITTNEISNQLPLSPSGIEKRKRNLGVFFNLENSKTSNLIKAAKEHGYL